jgi:PPE-repeat protein
MILDTQNEFSNSQAVTATAISTNQVDTDSDSILKNLGGHEGVYLVLQVDEAFAGTATTLTPELLSDSVATLDGTPTVHASFGALATAALTAGKTVGVIALPFGDYERYVGVRYTVAGGTYTAGKVSAYLTRNPSFYRTMKANNPASSN